MGFGVQFASNCWAWLVGCCIPGILGGGLSSFATNSKGAQLAAVYLVNAITATLIINGHLSPPVKDPPRPLFVVWYSRAKRQNTDLVSRAIDAYEEEMIERAGPVVLTSHRACLDDHEYSRITAKALWF